MQNKRYVFLKSGPTYVPIVEFSFIPDRIQLIVHIVKCKYYLSIGFDFIWFGVYLSWYPKNSKPRHIDN